MEQIPTQISCATDPELKTMLNNKRYLGYWAAMIKAEMRRRRNLKLN